jgi:hypothetical protein
MVGLTTIGQIKNQNSQPLARWPWPMMINVEANKYILKPFQSNRM